MKPSKHKVALLETTPNWHRPEFYGQLGSHERIDLMVYFCSEEALNGKVLTEAFSAKDVNWGENLVEGYRYKCLKNFSLVHSRFNKTRLFSYFNPTIWNEIRKGDYNAVVVSMWNDITFWLAVGATKLSKKLLLFAGDSTATKEREKPFWLRKIKKLILGKWLFPLGDGFLYRNEDNCEFFRQFGVPEKRLFFYPYSVDYKTNFARYQALQDKRKMMRLEHGIGKDAFVLLFVGRLAEEKRPLDLVKAFKQVTANNKALIVVGDGKLKDKIQRYIHVHRISHVYLSGFKSRSQIFKYYVMADAFVLPSGFESHGQALNEAMSFGLPVIVSDKVGAAGDLVRHNENGFIYPCGDTDQLVSYIDELADKTRRKTFGLRSLDIIKNWDHDNAIECLINALEQLRKE